MIRVDFRAIAAVVIGGMAVTVLAGCGETGNTAHNGATLSTTKSSVQLLRNEAASRVLPDVIGEIVETDDTSVACESESVDPDGISRSWRSSVVLSIHPDSAWRVLPLGQELADSFTGDGWTASRALSESVPNAILQSETSVTTIEIAVGAAGATAEEPATISIVSTGPCVDTDGADSDEIRKLDNED